MVTKISTCGSGSLERETVPILGLPVDVLDFQGALERIQLFLAGHRPCLIVTADAAGLTIAQKHEEYRRVVEEADLVTPDSVGVLWAGKRRGASFKGRVSGVDLVDAICQLSSRTGCRIYFVGSAPGIAEMAAEKLRLKHPGANIVGTRNGFFPEPDETIVAEEIAKERPDIVCAAMGIPRQELFLSRTRHILGAKVLIGVGGSLDVFSGAVKRAPKIIQKLNLEWLWRTLANPKKIAKAKNLPIFFWRVLTERV